VPPSRSRKFARGVGVSRPAAGAARPAKIDRIRGFLARAKNVECTVVGRLSALSFDDSMITMPRGMIRIPSRVRPTTIGTAASLPKTAEIKGIPI
jgi:hypothetical protein